MGVNRAPRTRAEMEPGGVTAWGLSVTEGGLWGESGRQDFLGPPQCCGPAAVLTDGRREADRLGAWPRLQQCRKQLGSDTQVAS